jgi:DegV family protein with EDD domain
VTDTTFARGTAKEALSAVPRVALIADSCCDLTVELLERHGIHTLLFPYVIEGVEHIDDFGLTTSHADFYESMTDGKRPTTTQIPLRSYLDVYRNLAAQGIPAVHISFSSTLSGTYESALRARDMVLEEFPDASLSIVDSLRASTAEGLLVLEAAKLVEQGISADDLVAWVFENRLAYQGYFTLASLEHLRRGGRVSDVAAAAGAMLDIKPILHIDDAGELKIERNVRGRKKSLRALADIVAERIVESETQTVAIGHGDAGDDAMRLRDLIADRVDVAEFVFLQTGPVIGSHTGPGMVSVVFRDAPVAITERGRE